MTALGEIMRARFERSMLHHLRAGFPDQTQLLDDERLSNLVRAGIRRAESYGIEFKDDIQRYLEYMMMLSEDFDTNPRTSWAGNILRSGATAGDRKMSRIDNAYL